MLKYVKKFIFSKVAGLQTYSQQLKQMNSFTYIFQGFSLNFKNVVLSLSCSPMCWLKHPHQILKTPLPHSCSQQLLPYFPYPLPPMFSTPVENPVTTCQDSA